MVRCPAETWRDGPCDVGLVSCAGCRWKGSESFGLVIEEIGRKEAKSRRYI